MHRRTEHLVHEKRYICLTFVVFLIPHTNRSVIEIKKIKIIISLQMEFVADEMKNNNKV